MVTIGAYDGVHLGHRAVIGEVRRAGRRPGPARPRSSPSTAIPPRSCGPSRRRCCSPTSTRSSSCWPRPASTTRCVVHFDEERANESRPRTSSRRCSSTASAPGWSWWARTSTSATSRRGNVALLARRWAPSSASRCWASSSSAPTAHAAGDDEQVSSTAHPPGPAPRATSPTPTRMLGRPHEVRGAGRATATSGAATLGFPTANVAVPDDDAAAGRRHLRRLVRAAPTAAAPPAAISLGQPPDVLRDRADDVAARGPPPRLRRRPLRRAVPGPVRRPAPRRGAVRLGRRARRRRCRPTATGRGSCSPSEATLLAVRAPGRRQRRSTWRGARTMDVVRAASAGPADTLTGRCRTAHDTGGAWIGRDRGRRSDRGPVARRAVAPRAPSTRPASPATRSRSPTATGSASRSAGGACRSSWCTASPPRGSSTPRRCSRLVDDGLQGRSPSTPPATAAPRACPLSGQNLDDYAELLGRVDRRARHPSAVLAGHSMGGRLVTQLAAERPDRAIARDADRRDRGRHLGPHGQPVPGRAAAAGRGRRRCWCSTR